MIKLTPTQERAATPSDRNQVVIAGAGTGKTTLLTERVFRLLEQTGATSRYAPAEATKTLRGLALMTFTDAAAGELKERVSRRVMTQLRGARDHERPYWTACRDGLDEARIGTIHSFCRSLVARYPERARVPAGFDVAEADVASLALLHCVREAFDAALTPESDPTLRAAVMEVVRQYGYTGGIDTVRRLASTRTWRRGLLRVQEDDYAAAIRALRDRLFAAVQDEIEPPLRALTEVLLQLPIDQFDTTRTVQDILQGIAGLRQSLSELDSSPVESRLARLADLLRAAGSFKLPTNLKRDWVDTYRETVNEIREIRDSAGKWLVDLNFDPDKAAQEIRPVAAALTRTIDDVRVRYDAWKREENLVDFDDLIEGAEDLLEDATIRDRLREQYQHLWVDEFQDTSQTQARILFTLAGERGSPAYDPANPEACPLAPGKFFAVGDPKQSIYRFRHADVAVFESACRRVDPEDVVSLEDNFRSAPGLIRLHNHLFDRVFAGAERPYEARPQPLRAHRAAPEQPFAHGWILEFGDPDEKGNAEARRRAEAEQVARAILAMREESTPCVFDSATGSWRQPEWRDFSILFRAATNLNLYEDALRRFGIPYLIHSGRGFYNLQEVWDLLNALRTIHNPSDDVAFTGFLRSPMAGVSDAGLYEMRGWGRTTRDRLRAAVERVRGAGGNTAGNPFSCPEDAEAVVRAERILEELWSIRGSATLTELLERLLERTGFPQILLAQWRGDQKRANLEKIVARARAFTETGAFGLEDFIEFVVERGADEDREGEASLDSVTESTVSLMTIHGSKGLEFPLVLLPDLVREKPGHHETFHHPALGTLPNRLDPADPCAQKASGGPLHGLLQQMEIHEVNAELKRLFYVAATRARDRLVLFLPARHAAADGIPDPHLKLLDLRHLLLLGLDGGPVDHLEWREALPPREDEGSWRSGSLFDTQANQLTAAAALPAASPEPGLALVQRCTADFRSLARRRAFHTTEILTYETCPKRYAFKYVYGVPEYGVLDSHCHLDSGGESPEPDDDRAAEVGTIVHNVLAEWDFRTGGDLVAAVDRACDEAEIDLSAEARERAAAHAGWAAGGDWGRQLAEADRIEREAPFRVLFPVNGQPVFLMGRLDGACRRDGAWTVFDYKTNRASGPAERLAAKYRTQLAVYAIAARTALRTPSVRTLLVCTDYQALLPVEIADSFEHETLPQLLTGLLEGDYPPMPDRRCGHCPYLTICEAGRTAVRGT